MQTKLTVKQNIVTGIMNALGLGRKRGGAGAVAAALTVCAVIASLTISAVGEHIDKSIIPPRGEVPEPVDDTVPPVKIPVTQEPKITYNGATPTRLPC
jgi:hypothetical protein